MFHLATPIHAQIIPYCWGYFLLWNIYIYILETVAISKYLAFEQDFLCGDMFSIVNSGTLQHSERIYLFKNSLKN